MSDQPKPLFALCEEWRKSGKQDYSAEKLCADELLAALAAWDAHLRPLSNADLDESWVREQILGLPKGTGGA